MATLTLEEVIASLADHTNDAIVITKAEPVRDNGPHIVWVNKAFEKMTGFRAAEVIGKTPRILQREDVDPMARQRIGEALQRWKPVRETLKNYRKDGTPFWVELNIMPVADETGWFHYWVAVQRDVTKQVVQTRALEAALDEAKTAALAQVSLLSTMSHELRTPLNGMLGMAQVIPTLGPLNDAQKQALATIHDCGQSLAGLIENTTEMSRIRAGKIDVRAESCDIGELVDAALTSVQSAADQKGLEVFKSLSSVGKTAFRTDGRRLLRALTAIVENAVKFTDQGDIVVRAKLRDGPRLELSVRDSGPGIAPDHVERIFEPFYQVSSGRDRSYDGAGLGLTIAKEFVERLGGTIRVDTALGAGSTFRILIPELDAAPDLDVATIPKGTPSTEARRVLVVADHKLDREIIEQAFRLHGWSVAAADSDATMVRMMNERRPDVIVCDHDEAGGSSEETMKLAGHGGSGKGEVPLIVLTPGGPDAVAESPPHGRGLRFFSKPVDVYSLVRCAEELRGISH